MDGDDEFDDPNDETALPKPDELLALHDVTEGLFETLREWFDVAPQAELNLRGIDSAVLEMGDPQMIAAMAMRKLQALRLISTPGVRTSTDVVIAIVNDIDRALLQAPSMYLARRAETTDWDAALADLDQEGGPASVGTEADAEDPEIQRFYVYHNALHQAVHAVVEAAHGEIRYFE
ncbi:MAG: hypothetical protein ACR2PK_05630 [Acidimicrobiales bacterium]